MRFPHVFTPLTHQKVYACLAVVMVARHISIQAFNPVDKPMRQPKFNRTVDGRGLGFFAINAGCF